MEEACKMPQEDSKAAQPVSRQIEEWAERRMRNVAKTYITKVDSNASLQKSDPEQHGPYLERKVSHIRLRGPLRM